MQEQIRKYHRTPHLAGSRLQPGDDGRDQMSLKALRALYPETRFIREEKIDGAGAGISFGPDLDLRLQSRGHQLAGGAREAQFALFKEWAAFHESALLERLEDRFLMFGEWCFARHSQFYDRLPHYFLEFDIWDKQEARYLTTPQRHALLEGSPVASVPVLDGGWPGSDAEMAAMTRPSLYRSETWREAAMEAARAAGVPEAELMDELETLQRSGLSEGVYVKIENENEVLGHYKLVHPDFRQAPESASAAWHRRPLIRNVLAPGVDLFDPRPAALPEP